MGFQMGVCSHYTHSALYSPFMQLILPKCYSGLYSNQYSESVTVTFSVAVTYTYNSFAYIIHISLQMHSFNVAVAMCMFHSEMSHDQ